MHSQTPDYRNWLCIWRCLWSGNEVDSGGACIAKFRFSEIGYAFSTISRLKLLRSAFRPRLLPISDLNSTTNSVSICGTAGLRSGRRSAPPCRLAAGSQPTPGRYPPGQQPVHSRQVSTRPAASPHPAGIHPVSNQFSPGRFLPSRHSPGAGSRSNIIHHPPQEDPENENN